MNEQEQYTALLSEIIAKQGVILGPDIAILKARSVGGITIGDDGKVISIEGDPSQAIQRLVDAYVDLSGQIVKSALSSVFTKYSNLKNINN